MRAEIKSALKILPKGWELEVNKIHVKNGNRKLTQKLIRAIIIEDAQINHHITVHVAFNEYVNSYIENKKKLENELKNILNKQ